MSLRYFYRPSWRPTAQDPPVEITDHVRLYTLDTTEKAEESDVGMFQLIVDDDEGALNIPSLTRIWAVETDISASSNTFVFHGYIMDRAIRRGDSALTSAARIWEVNVADENSIVSRRVLSSTDAKRPAETDVQRVQWLANHADGQLLIDDTTFLSTASPVNMDSNDYRGQTGADVLNDCAQASGKNHWFYFKEGVGSAIWYGSNELTTHNSMIRLTNVLGEVDNVTTFAISRDTKLTRDPSQMLSGVYFQYAEQAVYVRNMAMFPEIGMRDLPFSTTNVKTSAKAVARANRYLASLNSEEDRITTQVRLPAAKVNWIRHGMRIPFKATHLPGYDTGYNFLRVLSRSVAHDSEDPANTYLLTLELGTDTIPLSPSATGQPTTVIAADLTVGSAAFLGLGADREAHYSRDVGQPAATLTAGHQYRVVVNTTFNRTSVNPDAKTNNGRGSVVTAGTAVTLISVWSPGSGTNTATLSYDGSAGPSWGLTPTGGNTLMDAGDVIEGEWIGFVGSPTNVDVVLGGTALSGFDGFMWSAHVELQERDA